MRSVFCALVLIIWPTIARSQPAEVYWQEKIAGAEFSTFLDGPRFSGDYVPATETTLCPTRTAIDPGGGFYIADHCNHRIRYVAPDGVIRTIAGVGPTSGLRGDGGPANLALIRWPFGMALDTLGNLYFADSGNSRLRMVDTNGTIHTIADFFPEPVYDVDVASDGALVVAANTRIVRVRAGEPPELLVGNLFGVLALALDRDDHIYFVEGGQSSLLRRLESDGSVTTIAGGGDERRDIDGLPANQVDLTSLSDVDMDPEGNLYISEENLSAVRRITPDGRIFTVVEERDRLRIIGGPQGIELDGEGNLYIADTTFGRVRRLSPDGTIETVAGSTAYNGDGRQAVWSLIGSPFGLALDSMGRLYIADTLNHRVRRIGLDGTIATIAGDGELGFRGDGGPATAASLANPGGVAVGIDGSVYISDRDNNRVRKVTPDGMIQTIAGGGPDHLTNAPIPALEAAISAPAGLTVLPDGTVYLTDPGNNRVRKLTPDGMISTVAGTGEYGGVAQEGPATSVRINDPRSVVVDAEGGLIICDRGNHSVLRVSPDGFLSIVAGGGTVAGLESDGGPATSAFIMWPNAAAVDDQGNIFIADDRNGAIRKVGPDGIIHSLQAAPTSGPAKERVDAQPVALLAAEDGSIYYSDDTEVNRLVPSESMLSEALPAVTSTGVVNGASFVFGPVAPGMIISVFGLNLGPIEGANAEVSKDGFLPTSLAECRLLFDGEPAPMLFASGEQVNGVAPFSLQGRATTSVQIEYRGRLSNAVVLPVSLATPAVFETDGGPAILNQDGTLNSQENPAPRGSIVSVYATGAGQTTPPGVDGQLVAGPLPVANLPVTATLDGQAAQVLYGGGAPGLVHGALQVNIRVPETLPDGEDRADLVITVGTAQSLPRIDLVYE